MTTEVTFEGGGKVIIPDGRFMTAANDRRFGEVSVTDHDRYGYALIQRAGHTIAIASKEKVITGKDLRSLVDSIATKVSQVRYLGKNFPLTHSKSFL